MGGHAAGGKLKAAYVYGTATDVYSFGLVMGAILSQLGSACIPDLKERASRYHRLIAASRGVEAASLGSRFKAYRWSDSCCHRIDLAHLVLKCIPTAPMARIGMRDIMLELDRIIMKLK